MLALKFLGRLNHFGLLAMRVGLGLMFIIHGSGKIFGGPEMWAKVGQAISLWGINFFPALWGFMAAFAEFGGGILLILGFLFRPAALLLAITMAVATTMHLSQGDAFGTWSHAAELGIVFLGLLFVGPGKISLDGE